jgi:2-dehydropantoate 2-reductase
MGAYKASTLIDFERGLPLELESLFLEPLRQARRAGVPVPRLEKLCQLLSQMDSARRRPTLPTGAARPALPRG